MVERIKELNREVAECKILKQCIEDCDVSEQSVASKTLLDTVASKLNEYKRVIAKLKRIASGEEPKLDIDFEDDDEEAELYADFIAYIKSLDFDYGSVYFVPVLGVTYTLLAELHIGTTVKEITYADYKKGVTDGLQTRH